MENTPVVFDGRPLLVLNHRDDTKNNTDGYTKSMYLYVLDLAHRARRSPRSARATPSPTPSSTGRSCTSLPAKGPTATGSRASTISRRPT